jgi:hypothetical protein
LVVGNATDPQCLASYLEVTQYGYTVESTNIGPSPVFGNPPEVSFRVPVTYWPFAGNIVYFRIGPSVYAGTLGIEVGIAQIRPPYAGTLGVMVGITSAVEAIYTGTLGVKGGLSSAVEGRYAGELGIEVGIVAQVEGRYAGELGIEVGIVAQVEGRYAGTMGVKAGLASSLRATYAGTMGVKAGLASSLRATYAGTMGVKAGLASVPYPGVVTPCCTPYAIPTTLSVLENGTYSLTATYSSSAGGWQFTDHVFGVVFTLQCYNPGTGYTWECASPHAHCAPIYSGLSFTCVPFHLAITVLYEGIECTIAATYTFVFSSAE